jgi:hypothetical protein
MNLENHHVVSGCSLADLPLIAR